MKTDTSAKIWSLAATAVIAALLLLLLLACKLAADPARPPQEVTGSIALAEDFVEVLDPAPLAPGEVPAAATGEQTAEAQPAPAPGTAAEAGTPGAPAQTVASDKPSPHKVDDRQQQTGSARPQRQDKPQEQDEVANAFGAVAGQHNTASGQADQANAGQPNASAQGSYTGLVDGNAGGGWGLPAYAGVRSTVTGTVKIKVTIDSQGRPGKVEIIGGTPGASTNAAVRNACVAEVKRHTFTRPASSPAPESAIAIITYSFR